MQCLSGRNIARKALMTSLFFESPCSGVRILNYWRLYQEAKAWCSSKGIASSSSVASHATNTKPYPSQCILSKLEKHPLYACPKFKDMSHESRIATLKSNNLCMNEYLIILWSNVNLCIDASNTRSHVTLYCMWTIYLCKHTLMKLIIQFEHTHLHAGTTRSAPFSGKYHIVVLVRPFVLLLAVVLLVFVSPSQNHSKWADFLLRKWLLTLFITENIGVDYAGPK